jgi:tRNA1(Val) A37 N6-methylase TrmN6
MGEGYQIQDRSDSLTPWTTDTFFNGRIRLIQERAGYRYSIDAVILAHYAGRFPCKRVLDLGAGCGIIPLIMAYRNPAVHIFGVEVQSALAHLAEENVRENGMEDRIVILNDDMKHLNTGMTGGPVDQVVANPPFYRIDTGRINPNRQRAVARHEVAVRLCDVMDAAGRMLGMGGRVAVIYPAERLCDLVVEMRRAGVEPKEIQPIQSSREEMPKLILAVGVRGAKTGLKLLAPLVLYAPGGGYSEAAARMFRP